MGLTQTINFSDFYTGIYLETRIYETGSNQGIPMLYTGDTSKFLIGENYVQFINTGIGLLTGYNTGNLLYDGITGVQEVTIIRNPKIIAVSNLPNNVYYDTGSKYLQGYIQDEGTYHIKLHLLEGEELSEKTIILNIVNPDTKYLYKVNYPINIGFIKYNPLQRLGLE